MDQSQDLSPMNLLILLGVMILTAIRVDSSNKTASLRS